MTLGWPRMTPGFPSDLWTGRILFSTYLPASRIPKLDTREQMRIIRELYLSVFIIRVKESDKRPCFYISAARNLIKACLYILSDRIRDQSAEDQRYYLQKAKDNLQNRKSPRSENVTLQVHIMLKSSYKEFLRVPNGSQEFIRVSNPSMRASRVTNYPPFILCNILSNLP